MLHVRLHRLLVHSHGTVLVHYRSGLRHLDASAVTAAHSLDATDCSSCLRVKYHSRLFSRRNYITVVVDASSTSHSLASESFKLEFSFFFHVYLSVAGAYNLGKESLFVISSVRLVLLGPALNRLVVLLVVILLGEVVHVPVFLHVNLVGEVLLSLLFRVSHFKLVLGCVLLLDVCQQHVVVLGPELLTLL